MLVCKNNNRIIFKLNDVTLLSVRMQHLEKVFKHMNAVIYYEKSCETHVCMGDISITFNDVCYNNNYSEDDKTIETIIDTLYIKLCADQLYILDKQHNEKYKISKDVTCFTLPIQTTYTEYLQNL